MNHSKISRFLNDSTVSKFVTTKWIEVNDLSNGQYSANKNIRFTNSMLSSDLCDYSELYIVAKGTIDLLAAAANENDKARKYFAFNVNAPFTLGISRINNNLIENAEDLHIVMPMYSLLDYSDNCFLTSESLWNCNRVEITGKII